MGVSILQKYLDMVQKHRQLILDAEDYFWSHPETGYREWKTHAYLEEAFAKLGYELTLAGDIPGFTAQIDTGREGPTVAVFGEMDALIVPSHPEADPETGMVHACGHCAQIAALLGLAAALKEPGALDEMCGKILLVAVPAEELIEIEFRQELYDNDTIRYFGGKPEFLFRGLLDGVDMAFMIHAAALPANNGSITGGSNGCIAKQVTFRGVSAHAGGKPHQGVNALYAASNALAMINSLRETFQDDHHIRVHPVITAGGDSVNAIPDCVKLESYVRGATMDAIVDANRKVNRAIAAAAAGMGATVRLRDIPGYWPRNPSPEATELMKLAMEQVMEKVIYTPNAWGTGCSDMGDIGAVMPMVHPYVGGGAGKGHGNDYRIADPDTACVKAAQVELVYLAMLLGNAGAEAKKIIESYTPYFDSKESYFRYMEKLNIDKEAVTYGEENHITISY